ncbi:hypothetical protein DFP97_13511 [Paenibacillus prosopidis]|uniref:Uncharacterized protein n=1 Tax=Paenibacillus prosopidis TaxID=630520 RepID=A0A368VGP0_9BACL|nr:hypothetical protein DFP97_13511 [Paenibacillus prosopidis]
MIGSLFPMGGLSDLKRNLPEPLDSPARESFILQVRTSK